MFHRLLPPANVAQQTIRANGRTYSAAPGQFLDVQDFDAAVLEANGWIFVALSGPTASRPNGTVSSLSTPNPVFASLRYFDTDLGKVIAHDGATWRDPANGNTV